MRRKLFLSLVIALLMFAAAGIGAYAATKFTIIVNGKVANVDAKVINGTTYLPLRATGELLGAKVEWEGSTKTIRITSGSTTAETAKTVTLHFPADRYPETAAHIASAIAKGESAVCTIDRAGADENRDESLKGIPTKDGYDRDEWPMAICAEGGAGASVAYVTPTDNRGAGSWVGNQLEGYTDGTRVLFVINGGGNTTVETAKPDLTVVYNSCAEAKAAGKAPIRIGDPGYSTKLDRDGDGVACES
ncbi:Excalibur calcium-binding domain-containing protein [Paenibacillus alkaliterrae]